MLFKKTSLLIRCCFVALFSAGCSGINFTEWRFPYMYSVQQGNYITASQLAQLKPGMTKDQVSFVLGHPVSQFMFSAGQWQYIYQAYTNDKLVKSYIINVNFSANNILVNVESSGQVFAK